MTSRNNKHDPRLFQSLTDKEKDEAKRFLATNHVIEALRKVIRAERDSLVVARSDYDNPAWAHKQAHYNGEFLAYTKVLKILGEHEDIQTKG